MDNILRSEFPYKNPETENLIEFIRDGLRRHSKETLFVDSTTDRRWTGQQVEIVAGRLAKFLIDDCKLVKGDVCSIYNDECDLVVLVILAVICAGGTANFLGDKNSGREVHDTAQVMKSKFLISRVHLLNKIRPDIDDIERSFEVLSLDQICDGFTNGCRSLERCFNLSETCPGFSLDELVDRVQIDPEKDVAIIQFSSGTTGKPKPVPRTHKNWSHMVDSVDYEHLLSMKPGVILSGLLLINYRPGIWAILATIKCGNTLVHWCNMTDVRGALELVAKYRVNIFGSGVYLFSLLGSEGIKMKDEFDLSSWREIMTFGAKIVNQELPERIVREYKLEAIRQVYSSTETGWCCLMDRRLARDSFMSVGKVCPNMEAIVMDRVTGAILGPNEVGEIAFRGPQIFPGYLTDESGVFNRSCFTEDGWFKIEDYGYYDEQGNLHLEGRFSELMMMKNEIKFFPSALEAVLVDHPDVDKACVVKLRQDGQDYLYDVARAYVIPKQGCTVDLKDLVDFAVSKLPVCRFDGGIKVLDEFPLTKSGKIDKQTLIKSEKYLSDE